VPRITRTAEVTWEGNVARGNGAITAGSGAFTGLPFSLPTRIGAAEGKTSPEELLAAAHAGCFAMGLAAELTGVEAPAERLDVTCTITMDEVEGHGHQIVGSAIEAVAHVPALDPAAFDGLVEAADAGCPFSTLLKNAGVTVALNATLEPTG
jgi:osmotically inducible protein OsmC